MQRLNVARDITLASLGGALVPMSVLEELLAPISADAEENNRQSSIGQLARIYVSPYRQARNRQLVFAAGASVLTYLSSQLLPLFAKGMSTTMSTALTAGIGLYAVLFGAMALSAQLKADRMQRAIDACSEYLDDYDDCLMFFGELLPPELRGANSFTRDELTRALDAGNDYDKLRRALGEGQNPTHSRPDYVRRGRNFVRWMSGESGPNYIRAWQLSMMLGSREFSKLCLVSGVKTGVLRETKGKRGSVYSFTVSPRVEDDVEKP